MPTDAQNLAAWGNVWEGMKALPGNAASLAGWTWENLPSPAQDWKSANRVPKEKAAWQPAMGSVQKPNPLLASLDPVAQMTAGLPPEVERVIMTGNDGLGGKPPKTPAAIGGGGGGGTKGGPMTYAQLLQAIKEKGDALAQDQRNSADSLKTHLSPLMQGDLQYDLSPLAALVDEETGSNLAKSYKTPESGKERRASIMGLQQGISDTGIKARGTELEALKQLAQGTWDIEKFNADEDYRKKSLAAQTQRYAGLGGGKILPAGAVENYTEFQGTVALAGDLSSVIQNGAHLMGPIEGLKSKNPFSKDHRTLLASFDGMRQRIGKMIEGGVLRKEDESKYERILPTITDLPDVALSKAVALEQMLNRDLERYMDNFGRAGYKVSGFTGQSLAGGSTDKPTEVNQTGPDGKLYTYYLNPKTGEYE